MCTHAAAGTGDVVINIGAVNRQASVTGLASAEVLASARSLSTESQRLKFEIEKFVTKCGRNECGRNECGRNECGRSRAPPRGRLGLRRA